MQFFPCCNRISKCRKVFCVDRNEGWLGSSKAPRKIVDSMIGMKTLPLDCISFAGNDSQNVVKYVAQIVLSGGKAEWSLCYSDLRKETKHKSSRSLFHYDSIALTKKYYTCKWPWNATVHKVVLGRTSWLFGIENVTPFKWVLTHFLAMSTVVFVVL